MHHTYCITRNFHAHYCRLGEWLGGRNAEAQFRRSLSDDLRGVAASLVEQLVYEGALIVGRDELLMNLRNTTVHFVSVYNNYEQVAINNEQYSL